MDSKKPEKPSPLRTQPEYEHNALHYAELYEKIKTRLQTVNPAKIRNKTSQTYDKAKLRTYLQNPNNNIDNLRNLSRFLFTRSQIYKKIIYDNATLINTDYRTIIPNVDFTKKKKTSDDKMRKSFVDTAKIVEKMNLRSEMLKAYVEAWTVDAFFGVYYYFDKEGGIMLPLDPKYCQIVGMYPTGDFMYAFDCTYFTGRSEELELWGEPFTSMYRAYESQGQAGKWQLMPDEYACCFKVNNHDYLYAIPPYINLFDSIINIEDLKEITAVADEAQIYKLLVFYMDTLTNTTQVDDFSVDPQTSIEYFNRAAANLDDYTSAILSPLKVDTISFTNDAAGDVNKVENASKNILKTSGHSTTAEPEGTTAVLAAIRADEDYAIASLLPQTEAWVNRFLSYKLSSPCRVHFLHVTRNTKDLYKESLLKDMNYGLPVAMTLGALDGYSELDLLSMAEANRVLGVEELFTPFRTAATRSSDEGGRPANDIPTDKSESSEDDREKAG